MLRSRAGLLGIAAIALTASCGKSAEDPLGPMPFDPSGIWTAGVGGELNGSPAFEDMILTLTVYSDHAAEFDLVELTGTWEWAGLSGTAHGFWNPHNSGQQASPSCPTLPGACAFTLDLEPPLGWCWEMNNGPAGAGPSYMSLFGWFEDSATLVAAKIRGTYWEGPSSDPCSGPVLLSIDADASFDRT